MRSSGPVISVEVSYCLADKQHCIELQLSRGATAREAISRSGLAETHALTLDGSSPETAIGIFGKKCAFDTVLEEGDRVEIYRPLLLSPTEARRLRARLASEKPSA